MTKPVFLYKYIPKDGLEKVLGQGKLLWSLPRRFNDPFDIHFDFRFGFTHEEFVARFGVELEQLVFHPARRLEPNASPIVQFLRGRRERSELDRDRLYAELPEVARQSREQEAAIVAEWNQQWLDTIGRTLVLSLSEDPESLVMWAHYAGSHAGGLLCFRADDARFPQFATAEPIRYRQVFPALCGLEEWVRFRTHQLGLDGHRLARDYVYTKSLQWLYEREWRSITYAGPDLHGEFSLIPFDPLSLVAVEFGVRMPANERDQIIRSLPATLDHVLLRQARLSQDGYALTHENLGAAGEVRLAL
jgi:hypothetical protein